MAALKSSTLEKIKEHLCPSYVSLCQPNFKCNYRWKIRNCYMLISIRKNSNKILLKASHS